MAASACGQNSPTASNGDNGSTEGTPTTNTSTGVPTAPPTSPVPKETPGGTSTGTGHATDTGSVLPPALVPAGGTIAIAGGASADSPAVPMPVAGPVVKTGGSVPGTAVTVGTASAVATGSAVGTSTTIKPPPAPGQLTAGTWDDNLNFDFFLKYFNTTVASQIVGLPLIDRTARMVILVKTADGQPIAGAQVVVTDSAGGTSPTMMTGAEGRVLYFPGWLGVAAGTPVTVTAWASGDDLASQTLVAAAGTVELTLAHTTRAPVAALDLAFVVDTTGSMGDELSYLQSEVGNIVSGIATQFPNINQRWGLVFYRDQGDQYVVRTFDFTDNLALFEQNLAAQSAGGGGDMPEAVDQGLAAANTLSWRTVPGSPVARVQFWIADAPHHAGHEGAVVSALHDSVANGVHIYPVAGSGIDDLCEFTMRTAAEVTGGRYLFLTDDSGIGNSHAEPHIPCYYVTTLESAMRRMIATELSGDYQAPAASEIIRTGGDPQSQLCTLSDGGTVTAW